MNYQLLKSATQEIRDGYLRKELGMEKCEILDKYKLRFVKRINKSIFRE